MAIEIGDRARDTITGYQGIVIGITTWLNGCRRITLQAETLTADGKPTDSFCFDEPQIALVTPEEKKAGSRTTGGPIPTPQRRPDAKR